MNSRLIDLNIKRAKANLAELSYIFDRVKPRTVGELKALCAKHKLHCRVMLNDDSDYMELDEMGDTTRFVHCCTYIMVFTYGSNIQYIMLNYRFNGTYGIISFTLVPTVWYENAFCEADTTVDFLTVDNMDVKIMDFCREIN